MKRTVVKNVNDYFKTITPASKPGMKKLRSNLKKLLPEGEEVISYQIPTIKYKGKMLIAYAAFTNHYSIFPANKTIKSSLEEDLKKYHVKGSTIHFQFDQSPPQSFLKKIIKIRRMEIEAILAKKKSR